MKSLHQTVSDVDSKELIDSLSRFNLELRHNSEWQEWSANQSHKYAIFLDLKIYPVKG